jgi:hypothetical protein
MKPTTTDTGIIPQLQTSLPRFIKPPTIDGNIIPQLHKFTAVYKTTNNWYI